MAEDKDAIAESVEKVRSLIDKMGESYEVIGVTLRGRIKVLEENYRYMRAVKLDLEDELAKLRRDYETLEELQKKENEINLARRKALREQLESRERQIRELQDQRMALLLESGKEGGEA
jgi:chromosome segregation ATPase